MISQMKRQFSAGGIVFNDQGEVLLIQNAAMRDPSKSYWGFPKGYLEAGEKSAEAAVREVAEETGLQVEIVEKVGDSKYAFEDQGEKIFKVVTMFLMRLIGGELKAQQSELLDAQWFSPDEALQKLSFSNDKSHLKKALEVYGK